MALPICCLVHGINLSLREAAQKVNKIGTICKRNSSELLKKVLKSLLKELKLQY